MDSRQPLKDWTQLVWTNVDIHDSQQAQKLASDGHSSTAGHWTVRRPHAVHCDVHCNFKEQEYLLCSFSLCTLSGRASIISTTHQACFIPLTL